MFRLTYAEVNLLCFAPKFFHFQFQACRTPVEDARIAGQFKFSLGPADDPPEAGVVDWLRRSAHCHCGESTAFQDSLEKNCVWSCDVEIFLGDVAFVINKLRLAVLGFEGRLEVLEVPNDVQMSIQN